MASVSAAPARPVPPAGPQAVVVHRDADLATQAPQGIPAVEADPEFARDHAHVEVRGATHGSEEHGENPYGSGCSAQVDGELTGSGES